MAHAQIGLRRIFGGLASSFGELGRARSRSDEFQRLSGLSDDELARIGLKRENIARHVFRDVLYF